MSWVGHIFDAVYYHYMTIRWNEEFAVAPGLANLESRIGFNSNNLLIGAIFTFRFLFGEAIYTFQSVPMLLVMLWMFLELARNKYELKRVILFILFFFFFVVNIDYFTDSSTDFIPNIFIFYIIARLILYPEIFKDSVFLYFLIPVTLFTFKLSSVPMCIMSLGTLIYLFKQKDYRTVSVLITFALIIAVSWIIRTVIITGYLFYPFSALDIFSFDWKLSKEVVDFESYGISAFARWEFFGFTIFNFKEYGFGDHKWFYMVLLIRTIMCIITILSPLWIGYKIIKKEYVPKSYYWAYGALLVYTVLWYFLAPSFRFANGALFGMSFLVVSLFIPKEKYCPKMHLPIMSLCILLLFLSSFKRTYNFYKLLYPVSLKEGRTPFYSALYIPYSSIHQAEARHNPQEFSEYKMGNHVVIFVSNNTRQGICYDIFPATSSGRLSAHTRSPGIETIELRGKTLQEGFRPKGQH
jgi:hypothetical protein